MRILSQPDDLICEVVDDTVIVDPLIGRQAPTDGDDDSLWIANQMCDLVQVRSSSAGTTVRVHAWREARPAQTPDRELLNLPRRQVLPLRCG